MAFELTGNTITDRLIKLYATSEDERKGNDRLLRGFVPFGYLSLATEGLKDVEKWCDYPYRVVWADEAERIIFTYCEGDLSLNIYPTDEAYQKGYKSANQFYDEY